MKEEKIKRTWKQKAKHIITIGLNLFSIYLVMLLISNWGTTSAWIIFGIILLIAGIRIAVAWDQYNLVTNLGVEHIRIWKAFKKQKEKK